MLKYIRFVIKEFILLPQNIRIGSYILLLLITLSVILPKLLNTVFVPKAEPFSEAEIKTFDSIFNTLSNKQKIENIPFNELFNPNIIDYETWLQIGVEPNTAKRIKNYLGKNGKFRKPADLLKIYGFDTALYAKIEPLIRIDDQKRNSIENYKKGKIIENSSAQSNKNTLTIQHLVRKQINLNTADSAILVGLKGIGPVYASRIIKYRQLLGGYATTSQILEVYGLPNETFLAVKDYLMVDPNDIDKFNLNVSTFERMLKHPYIGKYKAQLIEKLRKSLKGTINKNDLIENNIFSETEIERLLPYLMF